MLGEVYNRPTTNKEGFHGAALPFPPVITSFLILFPFLPEFCESTMTEPALCDVEFPVSRGK
jgi:hypothetical protein